jgi:hypothetical protein
VYWQYRTILFEFQKDGLLGDKYVDDEDVENILNEQGRSGWELVNVSPVEEGLLAFLKREIKPVARQVRAKPAAPPAGESSGSRETGKAAGQPPVRPPEKKRKENIVRGKGDLIGGIKIS